MNDIFASETFVLDIVIALVLMVLLIAVAAFVCFRLLRHKAQRAAIFITLFYLILVSTFFSIGVALFGEAWLAWIVPIGVIGGIFIPVFLYSVASGIGVKEKGAVQAPVEKARQKEEKVSRKEEKKSKAQKRKALSKQGKPEKTEVLPTPTQKTSRNKRTLVTKEHVQGAKRRRGSLGTGVHAKQASGQSEPNLQLNSDQAQAPINEAAAMNRNAGHDAAVQKPFVSEGLGRTKEDAPVAPRRRRPSVSNASEMRYSKQAPAQIPSSVGNQEKVNDDIPQKTEAYTVPRRQRAAASTEWRSLRHTSVELIKQDSESSDTDTTEAAKTWSDTRTDEAFEREIVLDLPINEKIAFWTRRHPVTSVAQEEAALQDPQSPGTPVEYAAPVIQEEIVFQEERSSVNRVTQEKATPQGQQRPTTPAVQEYMIFSEPAIPSQPSDFYEAKQENDLAGYDAAAIATIATDEAASKRTPSLEEIDLSQAKNNVFIPMDELHAQELWRLHAVEADIRGEDLYAMPTPAVSSEAGSETYSELPPKSLERAIEEAKPLTIEGAGIAPQEGSDLLPAQSTVEDKETQDISFASVYTKAEQLKDKGHFIPAAVLFEKAALLSSNDSEKKAALFAELACYAISNKKSKAYAKAISLKETYQLDDEENTKLNIIIQLLEA